MDIFPSRGCLRPGGGDTPLPGLPFGHHRLARRVRDSEGMYDPGSGERLHIVDKGEVMIGDKVSSGIVKVVDEQSIISDAESLLES